MKIRILTKRLRSFLRDIVRIIVLDDVTGSVFLYHTSSIAYRDITINSENTKKINVIASTSLSSINSMINSDDPNMKADID